MSADQTLLTEQHWVEPWGRIMPYEGSNADRYVLKRMGQLMRHDAVRPSHR